MKQTVAIAVISLGLAACGTSTPSATATYSAKPVETEATTSGDDRRNEGTGDSSVLAQLHDV